MTEDYSQGPRKLSWVLRNPLVIESLTEDDEDDCVPSSFVWPDDSDEKVFIGFKLSLNEYNVLSSTIDIGSDIAFGEDALKVVWLWLRNMRCDVGICEEVANCININDDVMENIIDQLKRSDEFSSWLDEYLASRGDLIASTLVSNDYYTSYLDKLITDVAKPGNNIYPAYPTTSDPDLMCNAATYIVGQLRALFVSIYTDLGTLSPEEILASLLGLFGWRSGPLYQLIGALQANDQTTMLADFDTATPDLICQIISAHFDQTPVINWIAATYPFPSVIGDALTVGVQSLNDSGKWAQWISVGALITADDCDCGFPWCIRLDPSNGLEAAFTPSGGAGPQSQWGGTGWEPNPSFPSRITIHGDLGATCDITGMTVYLANPVTGGAIQQVVVFTSGFGSSLASVSSDETTCELVFTASLQEFEIDVENDTLATGDPIFSQILAVEVFGTGATPTITSTECS